MVLDLSWFMASSSYRRRASTLCRELRLSAFVQSSAAPSLVVVALGEPGVPVICWAFAGMIPSSAKAVYAHPKGLVHRHLLRTRWFIDFITILGSSPYAFAP